MRAPTTLGLAALLLLALGGLYLSHVSLAADPAHHAPQGDLLARLRATEQRAAAAEKLAADAIAHAREMRLARDAAAAGRPIAPPAVASTHRDAPPAAQSVEAAIESWLAAPPSLPAPPAAPPKRTPGSFDCDTFIRRCATARRSIPGVRHLTARARSSSRVSW